MVHLSKGWRTPTKQGSESSPIQKLSKGRLLFFGARFCFVFGFLLLCFCAFPASLFSAFPFLPFLLCFSAFLLVCLCAFLSFPLFCFFRFCFSCFSASVPFYFHFFCSSVMCFCCSTSCSSASLLPFFTVSLFLFSFALFSPVCILNLTLKRP